MKVKLTILTIFTLFMVSCTKSDDNTQPANNGNSNNSGPLTKTQLLTQKPWVLTASTFTTASTNQPQDDYQNYSECFKDDIHTFYNDNTFIIDEGATKCNPNDPQQVKGSWEFTNSETKIAFSPTSEAEIIDLNETTLRIRYKSGSIYTYTDTYKHP